MGKMPQKGVNKKSCNGCVSLDGSKFIRVTKVVENTCYRNI